MNMDEVENANWYDLGNILLVYHSGEGVLVEDSRVSEQNLRRHSKKISWEFIDSRMSTS